MPSLCVFGAQWGDEGKGKIIDSLAPDVDLVVRYQGGSNAGHTVVADGRKFVLHLIPSGVLHPGRLNVIANGVAIDPCKLVEELDGLMEAGIEVTPASLKISARAHVIFEHHMGADQNAERLRGERRLGTTGRGIGPAYADKAARSGLRMGDLIDTATFRERLGAILLERNAQREKLFDEAPLDLDEQVQRYAALGERLKPFVCDTGALLRKADRDGKRLLFEAAQGAMLDLDHGTYPFVTSSSTGVGGIAPGTGFPPARLGPAYGIAKAYCTRVGEGPFPTEDHGKAGEDLRERGHEYGATTGRPRRCGWLDAVALRYALEFNGAEGWILTNLDVLSGLETIPVGVAYRLDGERREHFPGELNDLSAIEVEYEHRPGWSEDITACRQYADLPAAARDYVEWLEGVVAAPIRMISVGPDREQLIDRGLRAVR
ncbi:adenylosuccinate synthase [Engelhardtia mirabilis]|uniref:Adenylosuccinate synthetase n=1 Tax=Engelhardtia mirabilis TaxID=2528011 RepID=A0A518BPV1_9BACT|nr:Adenylosuccinate synthetase [Planctomycetes bacterium Pla133]QDV03326.1 Adenylosuccinate synthetase [Planctomycetes bacterium Pla86]